MRFASICSRAVILGVVGFLAACGGGGDDDGGVEQGDGSGTPYRVEANVTRDSCGERLSNVNQVFTVSGNLVDTSLYTVQAVEGGAGLQGSYSETNGECTRTYQFDLSTSGGISTLLAHSECGANICETEWQGVTTRVTETFATTEDSSLRINGERCNPNIPSTLAYRPSLFECNGNAAVLLAGSLRNNYSVVVRRNGQFNDRDPLNPSCGTNRCSPYKTQKRIELPEYQSNCLGASGFSDYFADVQRISIKFTALVTNPTDTSQFEQYCLDSKTTNLN